MASDIIIFKYLFLGRSISGNQVSHPQPSQPNTASWLLIGQEPQLGYWDVKVAVKRCETCFPEINLQIKKHLLKKIHVRGKVGDLGP